MKIERLYLQNFLSYKQLCLELNKGLNVVRGKNASGKTNLLESIHLSAIGKSARNIKDKDLIRWGADSGASIEIVAHKRLGLFNIKILIDTSFQKFIKVNNLPISKLSQLLGILNVVYFSPDEMKLIKESPNDRRRFLNIALSQQNKNYFHNLITYNKLLQQRNKLLKEYRHSPSLIKLISLVDESIIPCMQYIMESRKSFVEQLQPFANSQHNKITCTKEELDIKYETENVDFSNITHSIQTMLEKSFEKDKKLEYTTSGVHRDDLKIIACGIDIRKYGSQGQQRTAVLSLKLAEVFMFHQQTGEHPILLLDDVLSELDLQRQKSLLDAIKNVQTIITCTEFDKNLYNHNYMDININNEKTIANEILIN